MTQTIADWTFSTEGKWSRETWSSPDGRWRVYDRTAGWPPEMGSKRRWAVKERGPAGGWGRPRMRFGYYTDASTAIAAVERALRWEEAREARISPCPPSPR